MKEKQFHTVELSKIKQITVEDILNGKRVPTENLDYASPVPTSPIGIPHQSRDMGLKILQIQYGAIDYGAVEISNSELEQYRGRLGC